ncbi:MAG: hypothetical protein J6T94_05635 [Bacteroidaceae bacterium]|nr:hypothetical protein [Bacteroidaceae bacterium]
MKKFIVACVALLMAIGVKAQIPEGLQVVSLRIGDTMSLGAYTEASVPTSLTYEYCLEEDAFEVPSLCLGIGAIFGHAYSYTTTTITNAGSNQVDTRATTNRWFFGGLRGYVHYDVLSLIGVDAPHFDTYAALTLGARVKKRMWEGENASSTTGGVSSKSITREKSPMFGLQFGARYFIIPNVGLSLEAGYDGMSVLNFGIVGCF